MTSTLDETSAGQQALEFQALRYKVAGTASVVAEVRLIVGAAGNRWNVGETTVEAAVLVASELVTNAVRATDEPITLRMSAVRDGLLIEVHDCSPKSPKQASPDLTIPTHHVPDDAPDPHGWGMGIVKYLSKQHGVKKEHGGKTVWAVLQMTAATRTKAP
ncbi:ATP-binding protein [Actinomadura graeca]|uniref:ATP-binding protein n=1 Tax=Actinomadura graeca TaxID=2750812 RepID=A0ABX8QRF3_9ACTN|nr:ATP-binding protein [Actinomadura graeca]QXJ21365.1 ATP-binding protein [Actinomadura graeca]